MIQVSMGRRSRSPLSPLSLRMMSRADLIRLPRRWAVVSDWCVFCWAYVVPSFLHTDQFELLVCVVSGCHESILYAAYKQRLQIE